MNLDIKTWKSFQVGKIFMMLNGKGITQEEIADNEGDFIAVQSGEEKNGVIGKIDLNYCKQMKYTYTEKPCLTVARSGSAGFVSFQINGCVVGDSAKIMLLPDDVASPETYTFLQTVLTANRFKYTYGRKVTESKYLNDWIDLPIQHSLDGSEIIDGTHRFSDNGFIPDWRFMEDYIKSLHYKPLTTKNKANQAPDLSIEDWKEFKIEDIFDVKYGVNLELNACDEYDRETEYSVRFVARTAENNGVSAHVVKIDNVAPQKAGLITVAGGGSVLSTFYQPEPFYSGRDLYTLEAKSDISVEAKLFVITVIEKNKYRYSYGRQANKTLPGLMIKLPVDTNGDPDWHFMENYIKALPYGDRL